METAETKAARPQRSLLERVTVMPVAFLIAVGMGASALVRCGLGMLGDHVGDDRRVGIWALANLVLVPIQLVMLWVIGIGLAVVAGLSLLAIVLTVLLVPVLLVSVPAYYLAAWTKRVPFLGWQFEVPFLTDVYLQNEGHLIYARILIVVSVAYVRTRLFLLEMLDSLRPRRSEVKNEKSKS